MTTPFATMTGSSRSSPAAGSTKAALYNCGLALQGRRTGRGRSPAFQALAYRAPGALGRQGRPVPDRGVLRRDGQLADLGRLFAQILERKDLTADDKIEALGRRGFAQFQLKDLDTAERTFSSALYYFRSIEKEERLQTDFYLGLVSTTSARFRTSASGRIPLRLPEKQMAPDMENKARELLVGSAPVHRDDQAGQPPVGGGLRLPDRLALRGVLRRLHPRADSRRAAGRGEPGEARGLLRGAAQEDPRSCWRSPCGRTSRTS